MSIPYLPPKVVKFTPILVFNVTQLKGTVAYSRRRLESPIERGGDCRKSGEVGATHGGGDGAHGCCNPPSNYFSRALTCPFVFRWRETKSSAEECDACIANHIRFLSLIDPTPHGDQGKYRRDQRPTYRYILYHCTDTLVRSSSEYPVHICFLPVTMFKDTASLVLL